MENKDYVGQKTVIKLGNNLDQLLLDKNYAKEKGGLLLPTSGDPGTGNIVIKGSPGTGKSTLALQMLYQTVCGNEDEKDARGGFFALYFSLEEQIDHIINKMRTFRWENSDKECSLRKLVHLQSADDTTSPEKLADYLIKLLTQPDGCVLRISSDCIKKKLNEDPDYVKNICDSHLAHSKEVKTGPRVLLPMLSQKSINSPDNKSTYWERYKQIEKYLIAAHYINENKKDGKYLDVPELKMICIDSLNVFSDSMLEREEIFRLFDLFKRYEVTGIFVFESNRDRPGRDFNQMVDDIDFSADVVISLQNDQDKGYAMRYLEVAKSRYRAQVFGKHPYFIVNYTDNNGADKTDVNAGTGPQPEQKPQPQPEQKPEPQPYLPFWVYPSLHYKLNEYAYEIVAPAECKTCDKREDGSTIKEEEKYSYKMFASWKEQFGNIIPESFRRNCVLMINGPRNTFKSTIARDFLLHGLHAELHPKNGRAASGGNTAVVKKEIMNGLIISMEEKHAINPAEWWRGKYRCKDLKGIKYDAREMNYDPSSGRQILDMKMWSNDKNSGEYIISLVIKKKSITAEELIHHLQYGVLKEENNIKRVVLDEVNMIGVSYPFLQSSKTSGELFLNAFVSLLKKKDIDLIMTGTTGELPLGDDVINRAVSLSDLTISTKFCDIFGKQNVIVTGGGLIANQKNTGGDQLIPGVFRMEESGGAKYFEIDSQHLKGLVGFEQGKVYRPGLTINLFEEGDLQKKYNRQITTIYNLSFPEHTVKKSTNGNDSKILVSSFNDIDVEAMKETVKRIRDNYPLEGTVVSMVDEHWELNGKRTDRPGGRKDARYPIKLRRLYYTNCQVLAYRKDIIKDRLKDFQGRPTWKDIYFIAREAWKSYKNEKANQLCLLDTDFFITETLSCNMLDCIISAYRQKVPGAVNPLVPAFNNFCDAGSISGDLLEQLYYLNVLFNDLDKEHIRRKYNSRKLYDNSVMYICWYTQLREFMKDNPGYISDMCITGMPGGGFRGDWMIEVMPGSLSSDLGIDTLNMLCNREEEIKRFVQGVGLPSWLNREEYDRYNKNTCGEPDTAYTESIGELPAWIGSEDITLSDIAGIYAGANRRKEVADYEKYRYMLSVAFRRLMTIKCPEKDYEKNEGFKKAAAGILKELVSYINSKK